MNIYIEQSELSLSNPLISVTGSKSESNRLLLLQALYPGITIKNLSNSDDSQLMQKALRLKDDVIDIHHAGTAMRFLTAYFAVSEGRSVVLTGSSRMKQRPIKILVDAMRSLGADIKYLEQEGFPPLKIRGKKLSTSKVTLEAHVSSQYISALLLIAPKLEYGLELTLIGEITSLPYITMTLSLLNDIGVATSFKDQTITVKPLHTIKVPKVCTVESDWSSVSYFYSIIALSPKGTAIRLSSYKKQSLQGDAVLATVYKNFGVTTTFDSHTITLLKQFDSYPKPGIKLNLSHAPDIAQTIAVTAFGLGMACDLSGLHTLKIKETDRLLALKIELEKLGAKVYITEQSLQFKTAHLIHSGKTIATYQDHRMAMAFSPLGLKTDICIADANVVSKSYPEFWNDLRAIGFTLK